MFHYRTQLIAIAAVVGSLLVLDSDSALAQRTKSPEQIKREHERIRRELEQKMRAHKSRIEQSRREAERRRRDSSRTSTSRSPSSSTSRQPTSTSPAPSPTSTRKRLESSGFRYKFQRGQEFAMQVEISLGKSRWVGTPYFRVIFDESTGGPPDLLAIGNLHAYRDFGDGQWRHIRKDDIEMPELFRFIQVGVVNTGTADGFGGHILPLQMSAVIPFKEIFFPDLPWFTDGMNESSTGKQTMYATGVPSFTADTVRSTACQGDVITYKYGCYSKDVNIGLKYVQTSQFNKSEGMVRASTIDYTLRWDAERSAKITTRRLYGSQLAAARDAALTARPQEQWPKEMLRVPCESDGYEITGAKSVSEMHTGQRVCFGEYTTGKNAKFVRNYQATVIGVVSDGKVRIKLDGSHEEIDVKPDRIHVPKT